MPWGHPGLNEGNRIYEVFLQIQRVSVDPNLPYILGKVFTPNLAALRTTVRGKKIQRFFWALRPD